MLYIVQLPSDAICCTLYSYLLVHLLHIVQLPSDAICCILYNYLLMPSAVYCAITFCGHLLHIIQLPSGTSAAYCTITFWYICRILYNYLLIHLLHIVQLPSDTSAAQCMITVAFCCCHLLHTLHYLLVASPVHYTVYWCHLLYTVLSYYEWCSTQHAAF
jgi:hypothetical protein